MTIQSNCFAAPEDIDLKAAQDEWDAVATITIGDPTHQATGDSADGESVPNPTKPVAAPNVTFTQAIGHFQTHTQGWLQLGRRGVTPLANYDPPQEL